MDALMNAAASFDIEGMIVAALNLALDGVTAATAWLWSLVR